MNGIATIFAMLAIGQSAQAPAKSTPQAVQVQSVQQPDFVALLNAQRAAYSLAPVVSDGNAIGTSMANNSHQIFKGIGHHVTNGYAQTSGMASDPASVLTMWLSSPSHAAILLSPNLTSIGYHQYQNYHTASGSTAGGGYYSESYQSTASYTVNGGTCKLRRVFRPFGRLRTTRTCY